MSSLQRSRISVPSCPDPPRSNTLQHALCGYTTNNRQFACTLNRYPSTGRAKSYPVAFADDRGYFKEAFSVIRLYGDRAHEIHSCRTTSRRQRRAFFAGFTAISHGETGASLARERIRRYRRFAEGSPTYSQWTGVALEAASSTRSSTSRRDCLHGFLALEDDTLLTVQANGRVRPA